MIFELPSLPFAKNALVPHISEETIEYHYGKHHKTYVDNLNKLITGTEFETKSLGEIIKSASGAIFNNAAQHFNHSFYWNCLRAPGNENIPENTIKIFDAQFSSLDKFKEEFTKSALSLFGSGWTWLVKDKNGKLLITNASNAGNPLTDELVPILTCDVWEHAYYIDYRNARAKYLEEFWKVVNWQFVQDNL